MNKAAELLVSAGSIEQLKRYIDAGANAVLIGESRFAMRLPGDIEAALLKEAVGEAHRSGAKAYVSVNKLFRNGELPELPNTCASLRKREPMPSCSATRRFC